MKTYIIFLLNIIVFIFMFSIIFTTKHTLILINNENNEMNNFIKKENGIKIKAKSATIANVSI